VSQRFKPFSRNLFGVGAFGLGVLIAFSLWLQAAPAAGQSETAPVREFVFGLHSIILIIFVVGTALLVAGAIVYSWNRVLKGEIKLIEISEEKFRTIFEKSGSAQFIVDDQYLFIFDCNETAIKLLGYEDKSQLSHQSASILFPDAQPDGANSAEALQSMCKKAMAKGQHRFEFFGRKKDRSTFCAQIALTAVTLNKGKGLVAEWRDLTSRKALEKRLADAETAAGI
jgi:PAS domain S-box-containing protein